jgi:hypothetical protein
MKKLSFLVSQKKKLIHRKRTNNKKFQYMKKKDNQDPLNNLFQMDKGKNSILTREVAILIQRLFYNVEEFYQIKSMIKDIFERHDVDILKNNDYFENLLTEVRAIQFMNF